MASGWHLRHRRLTGLPAMAWVARVRPPTVELYFGSSVAPSDVGIFEGTWVGEPEDLGPLRSTTPFGSGVLLEGENLYLVPPGHMLEGIYLQRLADGGMLASNSLTGLLSAAGLELDPAVAYPPLFNESVDGVMHSVIPTLGGLIGTLFHDNLRIDRDGLTTAVPKQREEVFTSFTDYRARLSAALASALLNARPYEPVVTISSGYDGAALAVLAAELGCRRAVTIGEGKPVAGVEGLADSGAAVGERLGMAVGVFERTAYQRRSDLPEAEFLAGGFTGEEVVLSEMEQELSGKLLVSGFYGDGMWWLSRPPRPLLWRSDQSGSSLGEWRLRVGFLHVPLACFGGHDYRVTQRIGRSAAMRRWTLGRRYDKPIPRRILEEAGVPRGTFGEVKRAASGTLHSDGPSVLAPATLSSLETFAAREGRRVSFRRRRLALWQRAALKSARKLGLEPIAARIERRKLALAVMEPGFGSLVLRWAISVVRPRYSAVADLLNRERDAPRA